ncbi:MULTISPECIES: hypothetical protein [Photorhabdus]|uniref:hypothetical protein n=1 Tax=Photorhabdus TaxID=29487 RepID=UPI000DCC0953|nr:MULTISPECIES: hypothetical protein [Photorhabdus]RAW70857.1 hypothetical protein CKY14_13515 [Photorhabdus sp. S14-60]MCZ1251924.1 hypothetical protein [Photorhabdus laumondii subsp. laumondii]NDL16362.1 hypothetical protein [Photorhabdus laumondii subsp. laumondii]NDL55426.1 hypothetical protein [Photorhabdus laumondii subsp. laumondii]RAW69553.1 hypothetical protein CKY15_13695 [Photorhabdus sp. S7-51]
MSEIASSFSIPTEEDIKGILVLLQDVYLPFVADFMPTALNETPVSIMEKLIYWRIAKYDNQVVAAVLIEQEGDNLTFSYLYPSSFKFPLCWLHLPTPRSHSLPCSWDSLPCRRDPS